MRIPAARSTLEALLLIVALAATAAVVWGAEPPSSDGQDSSVPSEVSSFGLRCPYGHEALTEWDGTRRIDDFGNLRFSITCRQCGARTREVMVGEVSRDLAWNRSSPDPDSFELPLHEVVSNFPILSPHPSNRGTYLQQFDQGSVWNERLTYSSGATLEELVLAALDYAEPLALPFVLTRDLPYAFELKAEDSGHEIRISIWGRTHSMVSIRRMWRPRGEEPAAPAAARARPAQPPP